jgi:hypothetical protein
LSILNAKWRLIMSGLAQVFAIKPILKTIDPRDAFRGLSLDVHLSAGANVLRTLPPLIVGAVTAACLYSIARRFTKNPILRLSAAATAVLIGANLGIMTASKMSLTAFKADQVLKMGVACFLPWLTGGAIGYFGGRCLNLMAIVGAVAGVLGVNQALGAVNAFRGDYGSSVSSYRKYDPD